MLYACKTYNFIYIRYSAPSVSHGLISHKIL